MAENRKKSYNIPIDWRSIIYRCIESEELDYKAAQNWHDLAKVGKAKFARHCMAMANTKGGYIVVGVGEDESGRPKLYTGLTEEQAKSFDPTDVGHFINKYSDPQIDFDLERPVVDGKRYAVFVIRRFSSLPHVCGYSCETELNQGIFYIRTADASSRPAYRASEIHDIVQRALRNQRELLGRMLRGILYEDKQSLEPEAESFFSEQVTHSRQLYFKKNEPGEIRDAVLFELSAHPGTFEQEKFGLSEIKRSCEASHITFPDTLFLTDGDLDKSYFTNVSLRFFPEASTRFCQIFQSGLFHFIIQLPVANKNLKYNNLVKLVSEAVYFLGQFYSELGYYDELFSIRFRMTRTEKVSLECEEDKNNQYAKRDYTCLIPEIKIRLQRTASDLASGYIQHSEKIIKEICERFNMPDGRHENLEHSISAFMEKRNI